MKFNEATPWNNNFYRHSWKTTNLMQQITLSLPLVGEKTKAQKGKIIKPGIQTYLVPFLKSMVLHNLDRE